jgi:hypothetical protein
MKRFYTHPRIGKARHVVSSHDGKKTHPDGSPFWDSRVCGNKRNLAKTIRELTQQGYTAA